MSAPPTRVINRGAVFICAHLVVLALQQVEAVERDDVGTLATATSSWALDRVDQRSLPLDGQYSFNPTSAGQGVDVYVVDSGTMECGAPAVPPTAWKCPFRCMGAAFAVATVVVHTRTVLPLPLSCWL